MDPKKGDFCSDYHSGAPQKLTYLQIDMLSFASLSLGNLTQTHVLWMHLPLPGIPCTFMPFHLSVKFTDACKRCWRNKDLRESRSYHFGPPQVWWPELVKMLRKCSLAFLQLGNLFQRLGLESSLSKDWPPSTPMPFLSFVYNTLKMSTEVS